MKGESLKVSYYMISALIALFIYLFTEKHFILNMGVCICQSQIKLIVLNLLKLFLAFSPVLFFIFNHMF